VTHGHADHASGIPALRARWPSLVVCAWDDLEPSRTHRLAEGDVLPAGDAALTVVHTPGHAADHVCFWDSAREALYAGDMLVLGSTVMIPAGRGGHLGQYLESLERLARLGPARVYPGHGPIITEPGKLIADYIGHREARERQVIAAIAAGHRTAADIARVIYGELPEGIRGAAELTIAAHLEKLREEGL
jgi:glyoxylase-like metal-dependent hydrolase (beta-lactamase superfamily II)